LSTSVLLTFHFNFHTKLEVKINEMPKLPKMANSQENQGKKANFHKDLRKGEFFENNSAFRKRRIMQGVTIEKKSILLGFSSDCAHNGAPHTSNSFTTAMQLH
jgi:hypothetical protein